MLLFRMFISKICVLFEPRVVIVSVSALFSFNSKKHFFTITMTTYSILGVLDTILVEYKVSNDFYIPRTCFVKINELIDIFHK